MLIYVLSRNETLYSTRRLVEAGLAMGWDVQVIDYLQLSIEIMKNELRVNYRGKSLPVPDAVIPRIGTSRTNFGTAIVRHFEMMNVFTTAGSLAIRRSRDKLRSLQILSRHGVDMPRTVFASNNASVKDVIRLVGGVPMVLKILEGTQGKGVVLIENEKAAKSVLDAFNGIKADFLVQEFIAEAGGADIRAFVVNGKVVGAMKRQGDESDFRSNLHQGGTATVIKLSKEEKAVALAAAKAMGLAVCGVDMILSARGPLVMEVNSSPGLEGIENATGNDIAGKIMSYIESECGSREQAKKRKKDTIGA